MRRSVVALLGVLTLSSCASVPLGDAPGPAVTAVAVIDRGWHTEIGLPVTDLTPPLSAIAQRFPGATMLTFGFGDRAFVLHKNGRVVGALGALLPNPGLILVTALKAPVNDAFGAQNVVSVPLSRLGLARVERFVGQSITAASEERSSGILAPYGPGPSPGTLYYASSVRYDAFNTCNTWVASALRTGGVPVHASGVLFASQIMGEVRRLAAQQGGAAPFGQAAGAGAGATVVPARGGAGLLLLKLMQPASKSGASSARTDQRSVRTSPSFAPTPGGA